MLRILGPLVILALAVAAFAGLFYSAEKPVPLQSTDRAPVVSVQVVEKVTASPTVRIFGGVETPDASSMRAGITADVVAVHILEGNAVRGGQVMIELDDADVALEAVRQRAAVAEIVAQIESDKIQLAADKTALTAEKLLLSLARKAVTRAERLIQAESGSEAALDEALQNEQQRVLAVTQRQRAVDDFATRQAQLNARLDSAQAQLQRAELDRARAKVSAPVDGRVTEVLVAKGDRVMTGTEVLRMYNESQLELRAQVPNNYLPALRAALDNRRTIYAQAVNETGEMSLTLNRLSANVEAGRGGVDAFFRIARQSGVALPVPGETLEINLQLPPMNNVIVLPPDALYGNARVYEVRGDVLRAKNVQRLGRLIADDGSRIIIAGDDFDTGAKILNSRLPQAVGGLKVKVAE